LFRESFAASCKPAAIVYTINVINPIPSPSQDLPFQGSLKKFAAVEPEPVVETVSQDEVVIKDSKNPLFPSSKDTAIQLQSGENDQAGAVEQNLTSKEGFQIELQRQELRNEIVQQENAVADFKKTQKEEIASQERLDQQVEESARREAAREQFFEDLSLFESQQLKLSKIFQAQSELALIGKHADLTA